MDLKLNGKVAIIAGGSSGIGAATAKALAAEGCNLIIIARNEYRLNSFCMQLAKDYSGVTIYPFNSSLNTQDLVNLVVSFCLRKFESLDILINCISGADFIDQPFELMPEETWSNAFNGKFTGYIKMISATLPLMKQQGSGCIVNIVGLTAKEPSAALMVPGIINAGLVNMAKSIANEYGKHNIRINTINPGYINTPRFDKFITKTSSATKTSASEIIEQVAQKVPLGKIGLPEDVANLVLFLVSERSSYITGTCVNIDGGLSKSIF